MGHHKRGRAKNRRAGCLWCKPQKANGLKGSEAHQTWQERKSRVSEHEQREAVLCKAHVLEAEDFWCGDRIFEQDCECSECCSWQENLAASTAYEPEPLRAPLQHHQTYRASRSRGNTSGISK
jgi:hypothetical protein